MAGMYKIGFQDTVPWEEAVSKALHEIRRHGDMDPVYGKATRICTMDHALAGEYLVRIETKTKEEIYDLQELQGQEPFELPRHPE